MEHGSEILLESGVSTRTGGGYVNLTWCGHSGQMTTEEARAHALAVLEAAEAADQDAMLYWFLTTKAEVTTEDAAGVLMTFRGERAARLMEKLEAASVAAPEKSEGKG